MKKGISTVLLIVFLSISFNVIHAQEEYNFEVIKLPEEVSSLYSEIEGHIMFKNEQGRYGFLNDRYEVAVEAEYTEANDYCGDRAVVRKGNIARLIDKNGNTLKESKYKDVYVYSNGLTFVEIQNGDERRYNYLNENLEEIIPDKYMYVESWHYSQWPICVGIDGKYGFVDKTGKEVIPLIYDSSSSFYNGIAAIKKGDKYGYIDKNGNIVAPFIYDKAEAFNEEKFAKVEQDGKTKLINRKGQIVYDDIKQSWYSPNFGTEVIKIEKDGENWYVDWETGELFQGWITYRSQGVLLALKGNYYGLIDENKNIIRDFDIPLFSRSYIGNGDYYTDYYPCSISDDMIAVYKGGKWGYMNLKGEMVIEPQFENYYGDFPGAQGFINGYAKVNIDNKWRTIDKQGNLYENADVATSGNYYLFYNDDYVALKTQDEQLVLESSGNNLVDAYGNVIIKDCITELFNNQEEHRHLAVSFTSGNSLIVKTDLEKYLIKIKEASPIKIYINGEKMNLGTDPVMVNDRVLVPMRNIFEKLGADVEWNGDSNSITATMDKHKLYLKINNQVMTIDGEIIVLDVTPKLIDGVAFVPVRAVSEGVDAVVEWNGEEKSVSIVNE